MGDGGVKISQVIIDAPNVLNFAGSSEIQQKNLISTMPNIETTELDAIEEESLAKRDSETTLINQRFSSINFYQSDNKAYQQDSLQKLVDAIEQNDDKDNSIAVKTTS